MRNTSSQQRNRYISGGGGDDRKPSHKLVRQRKEETLWMEGAIFSVMLSKEREVNTTTAWER